jgi:cytochrome c556
MQRLVSTLILTIVLFGCSPAAEKAAEQAAPATAAAPAAPPAFVSVPELKELMGKKVEIDSGLILNAAYDDNALKTDADWKKIDEAAVRIAEAGKTLLNPPLAKDEGKWKEEALKMIELAEATRKAIKAKDKTAVESAGAKLLEESCTSCHKTYFP